MAEGMLSREATIVNQRGLHARAAAKFVRLADTFTARIEVTRDDQTVAGTSILGLMLLGAGVGTAAEDAGGRSGRSHVSPAAAGRESARRPRAAPIPLRVQRRRVVPTISPPPGRAILGARRLPAPTLNSRAIRSVPIETAARGPRQGWPGGCRGDIDAPGTPGATKDEDAPGPAPADPEER